ncbi:MAG TPA: hypothetical protein VMZ53_33435, partial [Kofleriaceae bacterium]|nr:hypothetical protein [Kofleriaceae bacterium]
HFEAADAPKNAAEVLEVEAEILLMRHDEHALDDAMFAARKAEDALAKAGLPILPAIDRILGDIAFERRDFSEAHRYYDRDRRQGHRGRNLATIAGKVVGGDGKPVTVMAWYGDMKGDPTRLYTSFEPEAAVQTNADGTFELEVEAGWAIMAESRTMRSRPQTIAPGKSPTLTLAPTTTMSGTVTGKNLQGLRVLARYPLGENGFVVQVPVERDATFHLAGLIAGMTPTLELTTNDVIPDRTVRATKDGQLRWPYGQALDLIVRGSTSGEAVVVRGTVSPKTHKQLEALPHDASCTFSEVARRNTDIGREVYRAGDRHCIVYGVEDGPVSVCADDTLSEKVTCTAVDVKLSVSVEYPDGRFGGGTTPVVVTF